MRRSTLLLSTFGVTVLACATVASEERALRIADQRGIDIPSADDGIPGVPSPMTLTASDGTGLKLVSLTANAVVEDPLAFTELTLVFENPLDRQLEGQFKITLPQDASLSRFAMKIDDVWQEGEVVEKQAARRAYEDFLHRKQDPALLEQGGGNEFAARVFPIPARGRKEIVLSYSETLKGDAPYALPLRGLPKLQELDIEVRGGAGTGGPKAFHRKDFSPARDFVLEGRSVARNAAIANDDLAVARVVPFAESRPEPIGRAVVLVDTSASRALDLADEAKLLGKIVAKLPPETELSIHAFDEEVSPLFEGPASAFGQAQLDALVARRALGASNLELALKHAKVAAQKTPGTKRVILVTDGVATAGETDSAKLAGAVESLAGAGVERLDAVAVGNIRDDSFLRRITGRTLPKSGVVLSSDKGADVIARRLGEATSRDVPLSVEGARWSYPKVLDGVQSGDEILVYAELSEPRPIVVSAAGHVFRPGARKVERPLLERSWAKAKIDSLVARPLSQGEEATKRAIVELSTKHRVVSPHTSFLVLETEQDYRRFNIDRRAKLDILTVADGRVRVVHRSRTKDEDEDDRDGKDTRAKGADPHVARQAALREATEFGSVGLLPPPSADAPSARGNMWGDAIGDSFGAGGLGLSGVGEGGGGRGEGIGLGSVGTLGHGAGTGANRAGALQQQAEAMQAQLLHAIGGGGPVVGGARGGLTGGGASGGTGTSSSAGPTGKALTGAVSWTVPISDADRVVAGLRSRFRACYQVGLNQDPSMAGTVRIVVNVAPDGTVRSAEVGTNSGLSVAVAACAARTFRSAQFAGPGRSGSVLTVPIRFEHLDGRSAPAESGRPSPRDASPVPVGGAPPYEGKFKEVMGTLESGKVQDARDLAFAWQKSSPTDVLALVALGETAEKAGDRSLAARSYGSIVDLFGFRADSRRFAGARLERLGDAASLELAADTYAKAALQRPDHPAGHRLLAFALLKQRHYERAFEACAKGLAQDYPSGRFAGVKQILAEDLGLIAAAWKRAEPQRRAEIDNRLAEAHGTVENGPSLRFVLNWETDANDVDFHIRDGQGGHAYYGQRTLSSGGSLYADVTTGYGPECFTIRGPREGRAYPYRLEAHYFARGPMGYGMGKLQIIEHDGDGGLTFEERPYVVMVDRAYVDLGRVAAK